MLIVNYWLVQSSDGLVTSGKTVLPSEQMIIENGCHVIGTKVLLSYSQGNSCHHFVIQVTGRTHGQCSALNLIQYHMYEKKIKRTDTSLKKREKEL